MPPPALGEALEAPSSSPLRKPPSTQTPPGAPGASRSSPLCVGCRGPRHTAPRRAAGSSPSSTSPGQPHALRPSTRASRSPEGRPGPRTAPPDATLQGSPERGRPPAAGHVHSHSNTRLRPASAPRPRLAWRLPGQKAQPGPRRRHLRPRARAMFEKEGASQRPGPARAPHSRPPAPLLRVPGCSSSCWPLRRRWSRGRRHYSVSATFVQKTILLVDVPLRSSKFC